ncbi:MAG: hypothetical protein KJ718_00230 [Nanoarchaeota archaeon]|nr:hypothetical protein [Nanoarchaeota archaeon]MBU1050967.1 hypothetical protein [Nanoarchaeota archaeon]MBU1988274.1 hypothetical protein [Nanoarchaeota archaeon]
MRKRRTKKDRDFWKVVVLTAILILVVILIFRSMSGVMFSPGQDGFFTWPLVVFALAGLLVYYFMKKRK